MSPQPMRLWDFAGMDGLAMAQALFGPDAAHLSAYESLETECPGISCSLLRLGEGNFRVGIYGSDTVDEEKLAAKLKMEAVGRPVWVKPSPLIVITVKEDALAILPNVAAVKAPHRLRGLPDNHAVPVRIEGRAALVWRHPMRGVPMLEILAAPEDRDTISGVILDLVERST